MSDVQLAKLRLKQPRTLGGLIAIHESNFVRLQRLIPELDTMDGTYVSRVAGAMDLYLSILDRHKYTTTVCLTYRFETDHNDEEGEGYVFEPRARIRVYHDARAVEIIGHCRRKISHQVFPGGEATCRSSIGSGSSIVFFRNGWGFASDKGTCSCVAPPSHWTSVRFLSAPVPRTLLGI